MSVSLYRAPVSIEETHALLAEHGADAMLLAGGTDLLVQMRARLLAPRVIIDLKRLPLRQIDAVAGEVSIGALATHTQLASHPLLRREFAGLTAAARSVGGPALRNRGTLAGNIVNASPAADAVPPLLADDARVRLIGPEGSRAVPLGELFTGYRTTALAPGELLTEIRVPRPRGLSYSGFVKPGNRRAMIIATISIACRLEVDAAGRVTMARLAYGAVGPTALRVPAVEQILMGSLLDGIDLAAAGEAAAEIVSPITDVRAGAQYRLRLVAVHTRRLLELARGELRRALETA